MQRTGDMISIGGECFTLSSYRRVALLGIGKASLAMAGTLAEILGDRLVSGLVVAKHAGYHNTRLALPIRVITGGHPIPDENSLLAGGLVIEYVSSLGSDDLLFCLISGGGSALVAAPVDDISLGDLQVLTTLLLSCGARVEEINVLRRQLDRIKGGGLVRLSNGATIISLILSDVVGNPLEAIASGPTAPNSSNHETAQMILQKYGLVGLIPASIIRSLMNDNPDPKELNFKNVHHVLVGSNLLAAQAALLQAEQEGFHPYLLRTDLQGEARTVAFELATFLRQARLTGDPAPRPACIIAGGETTVTLTGGGRGGRNTELALATVTELAGFPAVMLITLATDGEDGSTDAAGAVVTGETYKRGLVHGLDPIDFLERNDSYNYFKYLGDLLRPGSTGTNVSDLIFLFTF